MAKPSLRCQSKWLAQPSKGLDDLEQPFLERPLLEADTKAQSIRSAAAVYSPILLGSTARRIGKARKAKASFDEWEDFNTVSFRKDLQRDYVDYHTDGETDWGTWIAIYGQPWIIASTVGILTAISGAFIEHVVDYFGSLRFGFCQGPLPDGITFEQCKTGYWDEGDGDGLSKYVCYVLVSTLLAFTSAFITCKFAPMARGSGIPEIKTILGGFTMPQVLEWNTLLVKIFGLGMSVAAGLSCGKEGPLVHIACCWCNVICKCTPRYSKNEGKKRELLSCACASGVAVAFGAPLGGVLFSLEEASTIFPTRVLIKAFTGSALAAWMLEICHTNPRTGATFLTMFNTNYPMGPSLLEYVFFVIIGVAGGALGALFVHLNIMVSKNRAPGTPWRKKVHPAVEVGAIALLTALTSFPLLWTRVISNTTIRALFHNCANVPQDGSDPHTFMLDLCDPSDVTVPSLSGQVAACLVLSALLRYVQMIFTFGCGAPSGLFIPSLYTGAALGRVFGMFLWIINSRCEGGCFAPVIYPGIYAMMGAAAVLGGVCRVTISLVVIMFELTSGLQLIVPFMIVCILAKWIGDLLSPGIYDYCITIRKYPFLHEPDDVMFNTTAADLLDEDLEMLTPNLGSFGDFLAFLEDAKYGGYPVVSSMEDPVCLGYLFTDEVKDYLQHQRRTNVMVNDSTQIVMGRYLNKEVEVAHGAFDLTAVPGLNLVDESIVTVTLATPADMVHKIFRQLGNKVILVKNQASLAGLITKKSFIRHMDEQHAKAEHNEAAGHGERDGARQESRRTSTLRNAISQSA